MYYVSRIDYPEKMRLKLVCATGFVVVFGLGPALTTSFGCLSYISIVFFNDSPIVSYHHHEVYVSVRVESSGRLVTLCD